MPRFLRIDTLVLACAIGFGSPSYSAQAGFKVIHIFNGNDGACEPAAGVVPDKAGNLYGTTDGGTCNGRGSYGAVYKLAPDRSETVLYIFPGGNGGCEPNSLLMDKSENLWGTARACGLNGNGVIFKITPSGHKSVVHMFQGGADDGCAPFAGMVAAANENFYGTTYSCGKHGFYGTAFELAGRLHRRESLPYSFKGGRDGFHPESGLIGDAQGNLYGTTGFGGRMKLCTVGGFGGCGTIFRLAPDGTKTLLYEFKGPPDDGFFPVAALVMDGSRNLYGTTEEGGLSGCGGYETCGIVFKLAPDGAETVLHAFTDKNGDGGNPDAALVLDSAGNLYGTTEYGGSKGCGTGCGTIFEIAPDGTETILHKFNSAKDGANPEAGLTPDGHGHYYGTASGGGKYGDGTVFEITP